MRVRRWAAWAVVAAGAVGAVAYNGRMASLRLQQSVDEAAVVVAPSVWQLDAESPLAYLRQAAEHHHFTNLSIVEPDGRVFLALEGSAPGGGLLTTVRRETDIVYRGEILARLVVEARPNTWPANATVVVLAGLLIAVVELFLRLSRMNRELDQRVHARTEELLEEKAFNEAVIESLPGRFFVYEDMERLVRWNLEYERSSGFSSEELRDRRFTDGFDGPDLDRVKGAVAELTRHGGRLQVEATARNKDGTGTPYLYSATSFERNDRRYMVGMGIDVTRHRRAEQERARLAAAVEQAQEAITILTPDLTIEYVNPAYEALTGLSAENLVGRNTLEATRGQVSEDTLSDIVKNLERDEGWTGSVVRRRPDGSRVESEVSVFPLRDEGGRVTRHVAIHRDVTERKQLEQQLSQSQKMEAIGTLAGGIAHDFNNILSAIMGYTELAELAADQPGKVKGYLEKVLKASGRARDLVAQILAFSRQGGDQEKRPVEVRLIVKEVLQLLRASLPSTIEIDARVDSNSVILADPTRIHQVVLNLCTNAGHAMHEHGGTLTVALDDVAAPDDPRPGEKALRGRHVRLTVRDTGPGMSPEVRARALEPFFTTKPKGEGTGMGLAVVHGIVEQLGGRIRVESEPGHGATFEVLLPTLEEERREPASAADADPPDLAGTERVLFVDDEVLQCELARQGLERFGYRVTAVHRSPEALERFRQNPGGFDVVVTDMTMPEMTGDVLARRLLDIAPGLPIILCTGFSDRMDETSVLALGVRQFAHKPIVPTQLAARIRAALEKNPSPTAVRGQGRSYEGGSSRAPSTPR